MLKAPPQDFRSGSVAPTAPHKPAELGDPVDRLAQRRWLRRRHGDAMDGTIERLPFVGLQQHATGRLGHRARQHGGVKNPPRQHAVERPDTRCKRSARLELTRFQATPAFQNPMPDLNAPATRVPLDALDGVVDASRRPRWSTAATRWARPRLAARLHGPARPTAPRQASPQPCGDAVDTRSRDNSAAPASPRERAVGRAAAPAGRVAVTTGWAATAAHT